MAIQQVVPITLTLMGDGTSTTFKYVISQLFAINFNHPSVRNISSTNVPNGVSATSNLGHVNASIVGTTTKSLQLTFTAAPPVGAQGDININFFYNSQ